MISPKSTSTTSSGIAIPARRLQLPALAAHVAEAALRRDPKAVEHRTTLKKQVQTGLESVARAATMKLGPKLSLAMVMADAGTGEIVGEVGVHRGKELGPVAW